MDAEDDPAYPLCLTELKTARNGADDAVGCMLMFLHTPAALQKQACMRRRKLVIVRLETHLEPVSELPGRKYFFAAKGVLSFRPQLRKEALRPF